MFAEQFAQADRKSPLIRLLLAAQPTICKVKGRSAEMVARFVGKSDGKASRPNLSVSYQAAEQANAFHAAVKKCLGVCKIDT